MPNAVETIVLSRNKSGKPLLTVNVTFTAHTKSLPDHPGDLTIPNSPAQITPQWGRNLGDNAKELVWLLVHVWQLCGQWGEIEVAPLATHMITDADRPVREQIRFRAFALDKSSRIDAFNDAVDELMHRGLIGRSKDRTRLRPRTALIKSFRKA